MNILNQFEFLNIFKPNSSVAFCGNAPSLSSESLGDWIDSHDIVVRMNKVPSPSYHKDVGAKTSILVCNPYVSEMEGDKLPYIEGMVVICLFSLTRRGNESAFRCWLNGNKVLFSYIPDIVATDINNHFEALTTGTYAINLIGRILKPTNVSVCGFTMFLGDTNHHYWSKLVPNGIKSHDFMIESRIFVSLINRFSDKTKLNLSSDIVWVSRKSGVKITRDYTEKKLNAIRWNNENKSFWNFRR